MLWYVTDFYNLANCSRSVKLSMNYHKIIKIKGHFDISNKFRTHMNDECLWMWKIHHDPDLRQGFIATRSSPAGRKAVIHFNIFTCLIIIWNFISNKFWRY